MNAIVNRRQVTPQRALSDSDKLEPVDPVYWKPVSASPIASHLDTPSEPTRWKAPIVARGQRKDGMRYLYNRGAVRMPISVIGTGGPDIGQAVWNSDAQPDQMGPVKDWGFNDALYQAGYPGFNLGLSFKVQQIQEQSTGGPGGHNMRMRSSNIRNRITNQTGIKGYSKNG